jgi:subtilisin family serine protease
MIDLSARCVSILDRQDAGNAIEYFTQNADGQYKVPHIVSSEREYNNLVSLIQECTSEENLEIRSLFKIAILDTGILPEHPVFKRFIREYIDFTDEGITDQNGHGSLVTLQMLIAGSKPLSYANIDLYICKILSSDGGGTAGNMIKGLKWAESKNVDMINLSAGIDNTRWHGLLSCKGNCEICKTAYNLKDKKIILAAAAGNNGKTVCPAKVSQYYDDSYVVSVGALDHDTGTKASWSGDGQIYMPGEIHYNGHILLK